MPPVPSHLQKPFRLFASVHKTDFDEHACLSDDAESITIFMLGRGFEEYQLYVNGREYDWNKSNDVFVQEVHLIYCLEMDRVLYEYD